MSLIKEIRKIKQSKNAEAFDPITKLSKFRKCCGNCNNLEIKTHACRKCVNHSCFKRRK